jgi:hypothetical protein
LLKIDYERKHANHHHSLSKLFTTPKNWLQKKICRSSSFSFHSYLQCFERNNLNQYCNLSYLTLISHQIFINLFLSLLLTLTAQCGLKAHKPTRSLLPAFPRAPKSGSGQDIWIYTKRFSQADNLYISVHITTS